MSNETIMLAESVKAKFIDPEALYEISEKLDGQPMRVENIKDDGHTRQMRCESRQGKGISGVRHIVDELFLLTRPNTEIVGELYIKGQGSAEISGHVRSDEQCDDLTLYVFPEFAKHLDKNKLYELSANVIPLKTMTVMGSQLLECMVGDNWRASEEFHSLLAPVRINDPFLEDGKRNKFFEGYIARKVDTPWIAAKRSKDYLKLIEEPTMDMKIVGVEEAHSKDKEPLGRVGAFVVEWVDENGEKTTTKVSKGKLKNDIAKTLWDERFEPDYTCFGKIIEVKYKHDAKYTVPRQPTFQRFRDDKTTYENSF